MALIIILKKIGGGGKTEANKFNNFNSGEIMKKVLTVVALLASQMTLASTLSCYGRVVSLDTGALESEDIQISNTNAVGFSAEGGTMMSGDLKLEVYRNLTFDQTNLQISKKNNSQITPFMEVSSSQASKLIEGQLHSLNVIVDNKTVQISCTVE